MRIGEMDKEEVTWDFFTEEFNQEYIGEIYRGRMRVKFIIPKQAKKLVDEYYDEFKRLRKYAKALMATDKDKCTKFLEGLNKKIHHIVTMNKGRDFGEMVMRAREAEASLAGPSDGEEEEEEDKGAGKRTTNQSKGPSMSSKGSKYATPSRGGKFKKWSK